MKSKSGFSLIEVTCALAILSFALVSILGLVSLGIRSSSVSEESLQASHLLSIVSSDLEATSMHVNSGQGNYLSHWNLPDPTLSGFCEGTEKVLYFSYDKILKRYLFSERPPINDSWKVTLYVLEASEAEVGTLVKNIEVTIDTSRRVKTGAPLLKVQLTLLIRSSDV